MRREIRVTGIRRLLNLPASGRRIQRDVDDEIRFHIDSRTSELVASGMSPDVARETAAREFGDVTAARDELRRVDLRRLSRQRRAAWWETVGQDFAYSLRALRTQPGFAAVVVLVLALGIGANVTMFGVIDRLLLRAPAYVTDPEHLVELALARVNDPGLQNALSYPIYRDMQAAGAAFEHVAVSAPTDLAIGRGRDAREIRGMRVNADYFKTLGVRPVMGRFFLPDEEGDPVAPRVAVLSAGFWQREFAGNPSAIGQTLTLGDDPYTIVGVAPDGFTGVTPAPVDVWVPLTSDITAQEYRQWLGSRQAYWLRIVARLRPGMTREKAAAVATSAIRDGAIRDGEAPTMRGAERIIRLTGVLPREARARSTDARVAVLLGAVSLLVLLIACANVANLQLARGIARRREVAVRIALGIDRARLIRQLVCETLLLALAAGVAAVLVTIWGGRVIRSVIFASGMSGGNAVDLRVVIYTAAAAIAAGLLSGVIPAVQSSRPDVADTLRAGARAGGPARSRTRSALLVIQAALTVVFLVGTILFVRSLRRIEAVPLGLEPDRVLVVSARTSGMRLTPTEVASLYTRLESAARSAPGVESAALGVALPFSTAWGERVIVPGRDSLPTTRAGGPYFNAVTPDFFRTLGVQIVRGRAFTEAERSGASRVAVVNETLANLWWPNEDPVGHCMRVGGDTMPCAQIVGVVADTRRFSVIEEPAVQFYVPLEQRPEWVTSHVLIVRPADDAARAAEPLKRALQSAVPDAPFIEVRRLEELVSPQMRAWRLGATMFGAFGLLAVVVAALGLYSVLAYDVSRRIRDLGVRIALGASTGAIARMVMARAVRVAIWGAILGFVIVVSASSIVKPLLFETSAREPAAFVFAAVVLFAVALLAAVVPTRRAARVDPIVALRAD